MQRGFDERMGVMNNLVERDTDAVNKVAAAVTALQTTLQKQQGDSSTHVDQLSGQIQSLNDSLDELKARLAKVSKQLEDMQASQQSAAACTAQMQAQQQAMAQAPPPDVLYNNALRDYNGAQERSRDPGIFRLRQVLSRTPTLPEIAISISARFSSGREIISRRRRATTRFCKIFQREPKLLQRS